jgi:hypothetical protein
MIHPDHLPYLLHFLLTFRKTESTGTLHRNLNFGDRMDLPAYVHSVKRFYFDFCNSLEGRVIALFLSLCLAIYLYVAVLRARRLILLLEIPVCLFLLIVMDVILRLGFRLFIADTSTIQSDALVVVMGLLVAIDMHRRKRGASSLEHGPDEAAQELPAQAIPLVMTEPSDLIHLNQGDFLEGGLGGLEPGKKRST